MLEATLGNGMRERSWLRTSSLEKNFADIEATIFLILIPHRKRNLYSCAQSYVSHGSNFVAYSCLHLKRQNWEEKRQWLIKIGKTRLLLRKNKFEDESKATLCWTNWQRHWNSVSTAGHLPVSVFWFPYVCTYCSQGVTSLGTVANVFAIQRGTFQNMFPNVIWQLHKIHWFTACCRIHWFIHSATPEKHATFNC